MRITIKVNWLLGIITKVFFFMSHKLYCHLAVFELLLIMSTGVSTTLSCIYAVVRDVGVEIVLLGVTVGDRIAPSVTSAIFLPETLIQISGIIG